jgi:hypothetical protein
MKVRLQVIGFLCSAALCVGLITAKADEDQVKGNIKSLSLDFGSKDRARMWFYGLVDAEIVTKRERIAPPVVRLFFLGQTDTGVRHLFAYQWAWTQQSWWPIDSTIFGKEKTTVDARSVARLQLNPIKDKSISGGWRPMNVTQNRKFKFLVMRCELRIEDRMIAVVEKPVRGVDASQLSKLPKNWHDGTDPDIVKVKE